MKLHFGKSKRPGVLRFMIDGYWYKREHKNVRQWVPFDAPRPKESRVVRWYGVTVRGAFIGFMITKRVKDAVHNV